MNELRVPLKTMTKADVLRIIGSLRANADLLDKASKRRSNSGDHLRDYRVALRAERRAHLKLADYIEGQTSCTTSP